MIATFNELDLAQHNRSAGGDNGRDGGRTSLIQKKRTSALEATRKSDHKHEIVKEQIKHSPWP